MHNQTTSPPHAKQQMRENSQCSTVRNNLRSFEKTIQTLFNKQNELQFMLQRRVVTLSGLKTRRNQLRADLALSGIPSTLTQGIFSMIGLAANLIPKAKELIQINREIVIIDNGVSTIRTEITRVSLGLEDAKARKRQQTAVAGRLGCVIDMSVLTF